jgi:hypothetical protein
LGIISDGNYIKEILLSCVDSLFEDFSNKSKTVEQLKQLLCSRNRVKEIVKNLANDISLQLKEDLEKSECFSI